MAPKLIVAVYKSFTEENIILETLKAEPGKFFFRNEYSIVTL